MMRPGWPSRDYQTINDLSSCWPCGWPAAIHSHSLLPFIDFHPVSIITPAQHMLWTFYQYDTNTDTVPVDKNIFVILILLHLRAVQCTSSRF